ncbi:hypothetical protein C1H87_09535 [Flavivirga eckloniae]|uniref:Uncharacterized protein n=1 Tax=Flavivirga eckloniae TaxID=1803846 RepID=A0A2K9PPF5_9FLAO|nr:hypothetical protein C1H87_09535 [Flavivirga eckloniae]
MWTIFNNGFLLRNNTIKRILRGHDQKIKGTLVLDGKELSYNAYLSRANHTHISTFGYFNTHRREG